MLFDLSWLVCVKTETKGIKWSLRRAENREDQMNEIRKGFWGKFMIFKNSELVIHADYDQ